MEALIITFDQELDESVVSGGCSTMEQGRDILLFHLHKARIPPVVQ
jgi:hypothetical protein